VNTADLSCGYVCPCDGVGKEEKRVHAGGREKDLVSEGETRIHASVGIAKTCVRICSQGDRCNGVDAISTISVAKQVHLGCTSWCSFLAEERLTAYIFLFPCRASVWNFLPCIV
jgi:hypothetical protein